MFRLSPLLRHRAAFALLPVVALVATGCDAVKKLPFVGTKATPAPPVVRASVAPPPPPQIDYAKVRPNELGKIPVVMYHDIGGIPPKREDGLHRSVAAFEQDLKLLYDAGFRPVNMGDVLAGKIDVPAGKSPVVITFDDARESQFRLTETATEQRIDPQCGLGVLQAFHKKHKDWGLKATFFALPKGPKTADAFKQVGKGDEKLQYLVANGFEIGNHSLNHRDMSRMTPAQIQAEIGGAHNSLMTAAPEAKIAVVALPMGKFPKDKANLKYLTAGTADGKSYAYEGAMLAAYRPVDSPFNKAFDPLRMERIAPYDKDPNGLRNWIVKLSASSGGRFVSDGDAQTVSYPQGEQAQVNTARIEKAGLRTNPYVPFGGTSGAKPIVGAGDDSPAKADTPKPIVPAQ
ncbi:MAG: polysaccharide deacetylase family protein [Armatimonadetes bacterium]|nr:polysaccharide deacetylase family protein [Armatimonadota bacterium]